MIHDRIHPSVQGTPAFSKLKTKPYSQYDLYLNCVYINVYICIENEHMQITCCSCKIACHHFIVAVSIQILFRDHACFYLCRCLPVALMSIDLHMSFFLAPPFFPDFEPEFICALLGAFDIDGFPVVTLQLFSRDLPFLASTVVAHSASSFSTFSAVF